MCAMGIGDGYIYDVYKSTWIASFWENSTSKPHQARGGLPYIEEKEKKDIGGGGGKRKSYKEKYKKYPNVALCLCLEVFICPSLAQGRAKIS